MPDWNPALFEAYCQQLTQAQLLDFDDVLIEACKLDVTGRKAFSHLLVDEFQDISAVQYSLIRAWNGGSLFVIGDPDQSIYGFRGASGRFFDRLFEDFEDVQAIYLTENYRSTPEILDAALSVIAHNPGPARTLTAHLSRGPAVRLVQAADDFSEAVWIAKEISRMTGGVDMLQAQALGHDRTARAFSEIAVLCRTHRQLQLIENCLQHDDIPCVVSGHAEFLQSDEVRGVLSFFDFLLHPQNTPLCGLLLPCCGTVRRISWKRHPSSSSKLTLPFWRHLPSRRSSGRKELPRKSPGSCWSSGRPSMGPATICKSCKIPPFFTPACRTF